MEKVFFDNWETVARIAINTTLAYAAMVILLRISGKRTLSKMNAFDFIVTVALVSHYRLAGHPCNYSSNYGHDQRDL